MPETTPTPTRIRLFTRAKPEDAYWAIIPTFPDNETVDRYLDWAYETVPVEVLRIVCYGKPSRLWVDGYWVNTDE